MYKIGDVIIVKVKLIASAHFICELDNGWTGLCHISELSDYFVNNIKYFVEVGDKVALQILNVDIDNKKVKLSYKSIMPRFQKDPFEYKLQETEKGFKNLKSNTLERIKND